MNKTTSSGIFTHKNIIDVICVNKNCYLVAGKIYRVSENEHWYFYDNHPYPKYFFNTLKQHRDISLKQLLK